MTSSVAAFSHGALSLYTSIISSSHRTSSPRHLSRALNSEE